MKYKKFKEVQKLLIKLTELQS